MLPDVTVAFAPITVEISRVIVATGDSAFKKGDHKKILHQLKNVKVLTREKKIKSIASADSCYSYKWGPFTIFNIK
jgi:hypothetical protein